MVRQTLEKDREIERNSLENEVHLAEGRYELKKQAQDRIAFGNLGELAEKTGMGSHEFDNIGKARISKKYAGLKVVINEGGSPRESRDVSFAGFLGNEDFLSSLGLYLSGNGLYLTDITSCKISGSPFRKPYVEGTLWRQRIDISK